MSRAPVSDHPSARPNARDESDELHAKVRAFARASSAGLAPTDSFEELALAIARFQAETSPGYARLLSLHGLEPRGEDLERLEQLPAVSAETFRLTRVACHPPHFDRVAFRTSGTTKSESGVHYLRTLETYDVLALELARNTLFAGLERAIVVSLAQKPTDPPSSSLTYMMELFHRHFDGRALRKDPRGLSFDPLEPGRFLVDSRGVDVPELKRTFKLAEARDEALVLLGTGFSLAALLGSLEGETLPAVPELRVMITGGFKGKVKELAEDELRSEIAHKLSTQPQAVLGEYGMTELTSQLYEGWQAQAPSQVPASSRHANAEFGVYVPPPWLRILAVDPASGRPVPRGQVGLARFIDLGNVDSALVVETQDLVREVPRGFELLGRAPKAQLRGCSLPYEGLISSEKGRP